MIEHIEQDGKLYPTPYSDDYSECRACGEVIAIDDLENATKYHGLCRRLKDKNYARLHAAFIRKHDRRPDADERKIIHQQAIEAVRSDLATP